MVKSAFLNQNEDFINNLNEQSARIQQVFAENEYSNVEESGNLSKKTTLLSTHNNKDLKANNRTADKVPMSNTRELLVDELLGLRYNPDLNESFESLKKNEVLFDSFNNYSHYSNTPNFNASNSNNFNDSLGQVDRSKVYNKTNEDFLKDFFEVNLSSNAHLNQFQKVNDKLDTKEVQLAPNIPNASYLTTEHLENNIQSNNLTDNLTLDTLNESFNRDPLAGLYNSFSVNSNQNELNGYYVNSDYNTNTNYYDQSYLGYNDDLIGFTEFEKGLASMCDEASTQQGTSLLSSPEQLMSASTSGQSLYSGANNNLAVQSSTDSVHSPSTNKASSNTSPNACNKQENENSARPSYTKDIYGFGKAGSEYQGKKNSCDLYNASTSFGESVRGSFESLYKMDSLGQSLFYTELSNKSQEYTPYSSRSFSDLNEKYANSNKNFGEASYGSYVSENYKNFLLFNQGASGTFYPNYYGNETKREEDITPFTHVVSSVATVADTVTPLCSSDLNVEFSDTVQVLLERYLMGDFSVESELFSLFISEFNLEMNEVYNTIVKYCANKSLLYYSYKLLLQSSHLTEAMNASYQNNNTCYQTGDKLVSVDVYTQVLLSLLTTQDSTHLSRSLLNHLSTYNCNSNNNGYTATFNKSATNYTHQSGVTKQVDKVLRMYVTNIVNLIRNDSAMFDRFLSIIEDHQGRLDARLSCLIMGYMLQVDLLGKQQFESWMGLPSSDAVSGLLKIFKMTFFARLGTNAKFTLHFLDILLNPNYSLEFLENSKVLLLFLDYVATNFPLSYAAVVLKVLEKRVFNAVLFINALQFALKCDYGSMITKICLSALQAMKGIVPVEFTTPLFGKFEFITLENVNKLVMLLTNYPNGTQVGSGGTGTSSSPNNSSNSSSNSVMSTSTKDLASYLTTPYALPADKTVCDLVNCLGSPKDLDTYLSSMVRSDMVGKDLGFLTKGNVSSEVTNQLNYTLINSNLVTNLVDVCKLLFSHNNKELFVPLVECCLLVEDFQGCETIMKHYCDYYGMVSEVICEKVLLSIALKGNFNYVNRLLKGTQSYESCEVFLTHNSNIGSTNNSPDNTMTNSGNQNSRNSDHNGLVRISIYLVRICISTLNFTVAINHVKPLLRLNQQNEEISNTLMLVATRLDSRSKLDSFLSFCERTSILINEPCFNVILDCCIKLKNNKRLLRIINKFRVWGLYPNIQTFGIIIKSLSSSNMIQECEELFYNYLSYTSYGHGNGTFAFPSMKENSKELRDYVENNSDDEASNQENGMKYNYSSASLSATSTSSHTSANHFNLNGCNGTNGIPTNVKENNMRINEIIYGCMFDAYVNNNKVDNAMKLFEDMKVKGQVKPNTIMYTTLIKGYGQNKQLDKAMKLFRMMQQDKVVPNTVTYNSIIDACARVGDMNGATSFLEDMLMNNIEPDLITFSTIIKGYCVQSDMDKSFQLLSIMYERGIMPDVILYNSLLEGCVKSGLLWLCEKLWKQMQDYNIPPSNFTLTILIKMYGRGGQLDKVFELADELPKRYNFSINTHVYTCLMSACITNGKYSMVLDIYKYMKKNGVKPDAKTFETIIQGLSRGALFREAAQVVMEVYSITNSNNGEAQISNINVKILERLFQRYYSYTLNNGQNMTNGGVTSPCSDKSTLNGKTVDGGMDKMRKGYTKDSDIILCDGNSPMANFNNGVSGHMDDFDELHGIYVSLARRLELFGIKIPKF